MTKTALITGASAGIGLEYARAYAGLGYGLCLVARRSDRLRQIADELTTSYKVPVHPITMDLSHPGAVQSIVDETNNLDLVIDVLINNAGYGVPGTFTNTSWQKHLDTQQVMVQAVAELCYQFLPAMYERRRGAVLNIASIAGLIMATAGHTLYGATKAWMIRFSEALADEAAPYNVKVLAVCPGFTYSEFHDVTGTREQVSKLPRWLWMDADRVVAESIAALQAGDSLFVPGTVNRALVLLNRLLPRRAARWLIQRNADRFRISE